MSLQTVVLHAKCSFVSDVGYYWLPRNDHKTVSLNSELKSSNFQYWDGSIYKSWTQPPKENYFSDKKYFIMLVLYLKEFLNMHQLI